VVKGETEDITGEGYVRGPESRGVYEVAPECGVCFTRGVGEDGPGETFLFGPETSAR
jgi:hypothetical protein